MRLSELQNKDVINIKDGKKIGTIIDATVDIDGKMSSLIVEKNKFFISMFSNKGEVIIKWNQIEKIGKDVILVTINL